MKLIRPLKTQKATALCSNYFNEITIAQKPCLFLIFIISNYLRLEVRFQLFRNLLSYLVEASKEEDEIGSVEILDL